MRFLKKSPQTLDNTGFVAFFGGGKIKTLCVMVMLTRQNHTEGFTPFCIQKGVTKFYAR